VELQRRLAKAFHLSDCRLSLKSVTTDFEEEMNLHKLQPKVALLTENFGLPLRALFQQTLVISCWIEVWHAGFGE
jgi:hypothetical protein